MPTTRLAPSPTGALHLGNARTFLVNWLLARQRGWRIILRIEDIDWDEGPIYQSQRMQLYREAIDRLLETKQAYVCVCSRREVESAASAPHAEDALSVYPGTCRERFASQADARKATGKPPAIRFRVPNEIVRFEDRFRGAVEFDAPRELGDFVIAKADGTPAYQLAVIVDDAQMHVSEILRGDDLLDSTPRQMLLYRALGVENRVPESWHLPLVVGPDGRRLAKRHGDTRLAHYRELGVPATRVLALLARFTIDALPREAITFTGDDDAWLRRGGGT
jgi:glutamyl-tRNA synthetase